MSKKNETFEKTSLMSVKENFMAYSTLDITSNFSYTKKLRIPKAKSTTNQFILSRKF